MKIWFDLSNSPHINMFYDLIKELESEGNENYYYLQAAG